MEDIKDLFNETDETTLQEPAEITLKNLHYGKIIAEGRKAEEEYNNTPESLKMAKIEGLRDVLERSKAAKDALVVSNLGLVGYFCERYMKPFIEQVGNAISIDDVFQAGCIGLMTAADKWDYERAAFSTCASYYIKSGIRKEIYKNSRNIRVPDNLYSRDENDLVRFTEDVSYEGFPPSSNN